MLLTRASEYALLSLILLAKEKAPVGVESLSSTLGISKSFLAKVLQNLAKASILSSYKGVGGGFELAFAPHEITLLSIMEASEGKTPAVFDCSPGIEHCPSEKAQTCRVWPVLNNLQKKIDHFLKELTLADIMEHPAGIE